MVKNLMILILTLALITILIINDHELEKTTNYKVIEKDAKTEIRLYDSGEKYRCTLTK